MSKRLSSPWSRDFATRSEPDVGLDYVKRRSTICGLRLKRAAESLSYDVLCIMHQHIPVAEAVL